MSARQCRRGTKEGQTTMVTKRFIPFFRGTPKHRNSYITIFNCRPHPSLSPSLNTTHSRPSRLALSSLPSSPLISCVPIYFLGDGKSGYHMHQASVNACACGIATKFVFRLTVGLTSFFDSNVRVRCMAFLRRCTKPYTRESGS